MHAIWSLWSVVKSLLPMLILRTVYLLQKPACDDSVFIGSSSISISKREGWTRMVCVICDLSQIKRRGRFCS